MEALQLLPLCLVDGHVHSTVLLRHHLHCQFTVRSRCGDMYLKSFAGCPAPRCDRPARQPWLYDPKLAHLRASRCHPPGRLANSAASNTYTDGVSGTDVHFVPHHLPADEIRLVVQHLRVDTGDVRPDRGDHLIPNKSVAEYQLGAGHLHQSVQPDGVAGRLGVLHDITLAGVDALWVRRCRARRGGDVRCGAHRAPRDDLEQLELCAAWVRVPHQPRALYDRHRFVDG
jgi:hypothetical protein